MSDKPIYHGRDHRVGVNAGGDYAAGGADPITGLAEILNSLRKVPLVYAQGENVAYASTAPSAPIIPIANFAQNGVDVSTTDEWVIETAGLYVLRAHFEHVTPLTAPASGEEATLQAGVLADPTNLLKCISSVGTLTTGIRVPHHLAALLTLEVADVIQFTVFTSVSVGVQTQLAQFSLVKAD